MLEHLRSGMQAILGPIARLLVRLRVPANVVTAIGTLLVVVAALVTIPQGWLWQGGVIVGLLTIADSVDGIMARLTTPTVFGGLLDSSLDRIADGVLVGSVVFWYALTGEPVWVGVGLVGLVMGQVTPYVRARAASLDLDGTGGIAGRADRIVILCLGLLLTGLGVDVALPVALIVTAVASTVTVYQRLARAYRSGAQAGT